MATQSYIRVYSDTGDFLYSIYLEKTDVERINQLMHEAGFTYGSLVFVLNDVATYDFTTEDETKIAKWIDVFISNFFRVKKVVSKNTLFI